MPPWHTRFLSPLAWLIILPVTETCCYLIPVRLLQNTIAPAHPATTVVEGVCRAVSGKNKKLSKEDSTTVTRAEIDSLIKKVAEAIQNMKMAFSQAERYHRLANQLAQRCEETAEDNRRCFRNYLAASFVYFCWTPRWVHLHGNHIYVPYVEL